ncbi:MAG TPA: DUF4416 family protein [Candidatus Binatia bacterium]
MGTPKEPARVKYFVGILCAEPDLISAVEADLLSLLGAVEERSDILRWTASKYYEEEMGPGLLRCFISFKGLAAPNDLAGVKLATNEIEQRYRRGEKAGRRVNIDPGYVESGKLVLASTKNANHRIYLGCGIYAEVTLQFHHGEYHGAPHTYPDYSWPEAVAFFASLRTRYLTQLRNGDDS